MSVIYGSLNGVSNFRIGLFGTGLYLNTCSICKIQYTGDKLSQTCLDCAIEGVTNRVCGCKEGKGWVEYAKKYYLTQAIKFCPSCGGKLPKEDE